MRAPNPSNPVPTKSREALLHSSESLSRINWLSLESLDRTRDMKSATDHVNDMSSVSSPPPSRDNHTTTRTEQMGTGLDPPQALPQEYRTYKRRWFGLVQLVLLNIVVSWDWLSFAPISKTSAEYFNVTEDTINWLSTAFFFAFVVAAPITLYTLHKGTKPAILAAAILLLSGNWLRYVGARTAQYAAVMTGQILIGFSQPFVLAAPTRYSDQWFTERGRVSATAVASLSNPLGGALGQLISPFWVPTGEPNKVPDMVLYMAIISTVACVPSLFIPSAPPTPPAPSSALPKLELTKTWKALSSNKSFYLLLIPFSIYVGFFNATSSLLNQFLGPYGYSETNSGIAGAILIFVGLGAAAVFSPIMDRTHKYTLFIKVLTPLLAVCYLTFIFAPGTRTLAAPFVILAVLGGSSFILVPVSLEYLAEVTHPVSPEVTSVTCWTGGQLFGAIFIIIFGLLRDTQGGTDQHNYPPGNMVRALIFQGIIACLIAVLPMGLGWKKLGIDGDERRRMQVGNSRRPTSSA